MNGPWIQTFTGRQMFPLDPSPHSIVIEDIAHALAMLCRFTGHTRHHYSIAQHSLHTSFCVTPEHRKQALLHDAAEAYLNDLASPIKHALDLVAYREAEHRLQRLIFLRFGCDAAMTTAVKEADTRMLYTERVQLMSPMRVPDEDWGQGRCAPPFGFTIPQMTPEAAERSFLIRYLELFGDVR